ncbi:DUF2971 domain-containing protein [Sporosalibacterium faouarense]|uniref:DUF2971 domain-containing protein n=1 Tax=Sporosalibacterium faouarense TaxID=516123 RepID=UPI00192BE7EE|nr:DUF2971 domain-containing protein [Sporosalibacterium faouarense]
MKFKKLEIGDGLKSKDKIYRYISLSQFMSLVEKNRTYLTRLISWEDTWEVPSINIPVKKSNGEVEFPIYSGSSELFGQCWTLKEESDAMWRIYSPSKNGIKIGTSIEKLEHIQGLQHSAINKVYYYNDLMDGLNNREKFKKMSHMFADGLIKRDAFEHENEVRLITRNDERFIGDKVSKGNYIEFPIDVVRFIEDIVVDPRAQDHYFSTIQYYCKRAGLTIKPTKSELYDDRIYEKTRIIQEWKAVE